MHKVVVFNGPPGSGKDEAAEHMWMMYFKSTHKRFKDKLFELTAAIYNVSRQDLEVNWYTRELKEQLRKELRGLSPREALINVSENIIKPTMGHNYFGEALADSITSEVTFVSDSGFLPELLPVIEKVGAENVLVVRVIRPGFTFLGDSRDFLRKDKLNELGVSCVDILNNATLEEFKDAVAVQVNSWIDRRNQV